MRDGVGSSRYRLSPACWSWAVATGAGFQPASLIDRLFTGYDYLSA
jgi:hypothetical protein